MNKGLLIDYVREKTGLSSLESQKALDAVFEGIMEALSEGKDARFVGFGTFTVQETKERSGRNPRTGETITIPSSKRPVFKAGQAFKDCVKS